MWLAATSDSGCGIAPGCSAARSSSRSSLIPSFIGLLFPLFLCITQVPPIASVRGSLCVQYVVRPGRACFVCDLGHVPRVPSRIQHSHCLLWRWRCRFLRSGTTWLFNKRFNKIATQGAPQMAVDKEANSLSRVYSYYSKFNLRLFYV